MPFEAYGSGAPPLHRPGELVDQRVLGGVGVLVLVDQDVPEAAAVGVGDLRERTEQVDGLPDEVVEVEGVRLLQLALVVGEHLGEDALGRIRHVRLPREGLRVLQLVLQLRDARLDGCRGVAVRVGLVLLDEPLDERARVAGVVDRERLREAELLGLAPQDPHARRVERRDPHASRRVADELLDALAHLPCGLVREGDREDLAGPRLALTQQQGDAAGEHAGLARSRTGDDEQRLTAVGDCFELLRVESREQIGVRAGSRSLAPSERGPFDRLRDRREDDGRRGGFAHDPPSSLGRATDLESGRPHCPPVSSGTTPHRGRGWSRKTPSSPVPAIAAHSAR